MSVLLAESVSALSVRADGSYLDGTFGRGGHSREILSRLSPAGQLIAVDKDPAAEASAQALAGDSRFKFVAGSFADIASYVGDGSLDGILLDLGVSSP